MLTVELNNAKKAKLALEKQPSGNRKDCKIIMSELAEMDDMDMYIT